MTARKGSNAPALAASSMKPASDLASAVRGADLVYVALPIVATMEALPAIAAAAEPALWSRTQAAQKP